MNPHVLTVEETAKVLRIGRNTAYEQVRQGLIPSIRLGRRILVPAKAIERLLGGTVDEERVAALGQKETKNGTGQLLSEASGPEQPQDDRKVEAAS